jgi:cytochrome c biogenesis protein CcdA
LALTLLGLALVDSTSIGTIGVPIFLTIARIPVHRVLLYLATITVFYFLVGSALLLGLDSAIDALGDALESRPAYIVQFLLGVGLFALSFRFDSKRNRDKPRRSWQPKDSSARAMIALALTAGMIEIAWMVPYIAAIGILANSSMPAIAQTGVLAAYTVVMAVPALLLLLSSRTGAPWVSRLLDRLAAWIQQNADGMIGWTLGIVGFLLAANAIDPLLSD